MNNRVCEIPEKDKEAYERSKEELKRLKAEKIDCCISDTERLTVLKSNINLLAEIDGIILRKRLHIALINMAIETIENNKIQIENIEDLETLLYLELLVSE